MTRLQLALSLIAAVTVAGLLMWKAEATPLTGALATHAVTGGYSAVQKAGCMFGTHRCAAGTTERVEEDHCVTSWERCCGRCRQYWIGMLARALGEIQIVSVTVRPPFCPFDVVLPCWSVIQSG